MSISCTGDDKTGQNNKSWWFTEEGMVGGSGEKDPGPCTMEFGYPDGTVKERTTYTYYDDGDLRTKELDVAADGTVEFSVTYKDTSENNDSVRTEEDIDEADIRYFANTDENGNVLIEEWDFDPDGQIDYRITYSYDDKGNVLTEDWDYYADDTVEWRYTNVYDENDNIVSKEHDKGADGTIDSRSFYTYDEHGNMLTEEWDLDIDGTIDELYTYSYSCWEWADGQWRYNDG